MSAAGSLLPCGPASGRHPLRRLVAVPQSITAMIRSKPPFV